MRITLLVVGRTDSGWVSEGLGMYVERLKHYAPFTLAEIPELRNVSAFSREQIKDREGKLILAKLKPQDYVVLLDEHGTEHRSLDFAASLQDKISRTGRDMVFVVGGAYGFSSAVRTRADSMISLSRMTFSHQLVRVVFAEQLYRAFTIMHGEPYHHE